MRHSKLASLMVLACLVWPAGASGQDAPTGTEAQTGAQTEPQPESTESQPQPESTEAKPIPLTRQVGEMIEGNPIIPAKSKIETGIALGLVEEVQDTVQGAVRVVTDPDGTREGLEAVARDPGLLLGAVGSWVDDGIQALVTGNHVEQGRKLAQTLGFAANFIPGPGEAKLSTVPLKAVEVLHQVHTAGTVGKVSEIGNRAGEP